MRDHTRTPSDPTLDPTALRIARALDRRLHATLEQPLELRRARLYGCTLVDDDPGEDGEPTVRFTFLGDASFVYDLMEGSLGLVARAFDAAAVVTGGWGAPMNDDGTMDVTPSRHPDRFRILVTTVIDDDGLCSVVRNGTAPEVAVEMRERGVGMMPDALEIMWCGAVRDGGGEEPMLPLQPPAA